MSPFEVERALLENDAILEATVFGHPDHDNLIKPKTIVVPAAGKDTSDALGAKLQAIVRDKLADYIYPCWIELRDELPTTATGKIQRYKLRA